MVEILWEKNAPQSEHSVSFGRDANPLEIKAVVEEHLMTTVKGHTIPETLQKRFEWLAAGDAQCLQELLNYLLWKDRQEAVEAIGAEVRLLSEAIGKSELTGFRRELKVGGHKLNIFFDPRATGVSLAAGTPRMKSSFSASTSRVNSPDYSWVLGYLVFFAIIIVWFIVSRKH